MRGQFGQLSLESDIEPSSGSLWENHPNYPNCPAQDVGIGLRIQRPNYTDDPRYGGHPAALRRYTIRAPCGSTEV